jgi:hypothetical protein
MAFVVKAALPAEDDRGLLSFDEKTMYQGRSVAAGDEIFVFDSENQGGSGLCLKGVVTEARRGAGIRVAIVVRPVARATRRLGRAELKPFRELTEDRPEVELARRLYRQATNKIARLSEAATAFLEAYF